MILFVELFFTSLLAMSNNNIRKRKELYWKCYLGVINKLSMKTPDSNPTRTGLAFHPCETDKLSSVIVGITQLTSSVPSG